TGLRPGAGRCERANAEAKSPAPTAHSCTEMVRPTLQIAAPAIIHVNGLIHGLARRSSHNSRRVRGHNASRDAGTLRSGSVLNGNKSTSPMITYTNVPAFPSRKAVMRKKLLPVSD